MAKRLFWHYPEEGNDDYAEGLQNQSYIQEPYWHASGLRFVIALVNYEPNDGLYHWKIYEHHGETLASGVAKTEGLAQECVERLLPSYIYFCHARHEDFLHN